MNDDSILLIRALLIEQKCKLEELQEQWDIGIRRKILARIETALTELAAIQQPDAGQWEPLPGGLHYIDGGDGHMEVALDGSLLMLYDIDSIQLDPNEYRLCRRTPQPPAPTVPMPDWSQAPEWAQWWAVDAWGMSQFYEFEPVLHETVSFCGWSRPTINGYQFGKTQDGAHIEIPLGVDWRLLKVQRPPAQEP